LKEMKNSLKLEKMFADTLTSNPIKLLNVINVTLTRFYFVTNSVLSVVIMNNNLILAMSLKTHSKWIH
jgi:hypothetical protein